MFCMSLAFIISLLASDPLFAANRSTTAHAQLTAGDLTVIEACARRLCEEATGKNQTCKRLIVQRTTRITHTRLAGFAGLSTDDAGRQAVQDLANTPAYSSMIERSRKVWIVPPIRDKEVELVPHTRVDWCPGNGEQAIPYRLLFQFSAPGYAQNGEAALVYVHYKDCMSEGHALWSAKRRHGQWFAERKYVLWERGE